jgi:hypothetical protein
MKFYFFVTERQGACKILYGIPLFCEGYGKSMVRIIPLSFLDLITHEFLLKELGLVRAPKLFHDSGTPVRPNTEQDLHTPTPGLPDRFTLCERRRQVEA